MNVHQLTASLALPSDLPPGKYFIKVYADDGASDAAGVAELDVD